jgi:hypothetical protein
MRMPGSGRNTSRKVNTVRNERKGIGRDEKGKSNKNYNEKQLLCCSAYTITVI